MVDKIELPLLDRVQIATPCSADWETMSGDEFKRYCSQCKLHVYNLSALTPESAEALLQAELGRGGRTCLRLFRRPDGTVLTRDCPRGVRRLRLKLFRRFVAGVACLLGGVSLAAGGTRLGKWAEQQNQGLIMGKMAAPVTTVQGNMAMGGACAPPTLPTLPLPIDTTNTTK